MGSWINQEIVDKLEAQIRPLMQQHHVPGLSVALLDAGEIIYSGAFGVRSADTQAPVTQETVFEAASLSKPVFAYAALKLCEAGILELDTPLATYLPEPYITDEPHLDSITMRHVLNHTTGFPNWRPEGEPLRIHLPPGERFSYSGEGYMYLQAVVEHLTGQNPAEWIRSTLLVPLGMENGRYTLTNLNDCSVAIGHNDEGKITKKFLPQKMNAAASLHCTAQDFGRFMSVVMQTQPNNLSHLAPETVKTMLTPQHHVNDSMPWEKDWPKPAITLNKKLSWGLGWGIQHTAYGDAIWHWGDNGTYRAFAIGYPHSGEGVVILTNGENGQQVYDSILRNIIGGEYPALDWL